MVHEMTEWKPVFTTQLGSLYAGDCLKILPFVRDECVDVIFADPPFNLGKTYRSGTNDRRSEVEYLAWCEAWLAECIRVLRPGGSLFVYNLPRWNMSLGNYLLQSGMAFRHWIAIEMGGCFPIMGKLHPSHYSLLYFSKGKPAVFNKVRTPFELCRHCEKEVKDYGGHRKAMNVSGVGLKDVWTDIPIVRHAKYKDSARIANALSTKLVQRVLSLSSCEGDLILDPFGGSGTTYVVSEVMNRRWIGMEIDYAQDIQRRFTNKQVALHAYQDHVTASGTKPRRCGTIKKKNDVTGARIVPV
jgi:site-specific DNA-methyltransferase (adenine-specific)